MTQISKISKSRPGIGIRLSGQAMDRVVEKKMSRGRKIGLGTAAATVLLIAWLLVDLLTQGRSLSVNSQRITVSRVTSGTFEDYIPLRGRVVPRSTVYLDAIEGGRVEKVLIEDGALVVAGEPIAVLSNTSLQLEVLGREAAVTEQLNNMRTIELQLEQNRLSHKRNLIEIEYQIIRLTRSLARQQELLAKNLVSQSTLDELQDELTYFENRRAITLESQETDGRMQVQQLKQLRDAGAQMQEGLSYARKNLDDLNIRAPIAGKLSGFNIDVGQSIERGGRLGQVDDPNGYKLNVKIDEFYLGRTDLQQTASLEHDNRRHELRISKIYPQVNGGQFEVDMLFDQEPADLRRGQTMQLKLTLGDNSEAILIPNGSFYQETGGNWIFVVSADGREAIKRTVKLGRRNKDLIEVLDGLEAGEEVITSPYTSYTGMDRLSLSEN